MTKSITCAEKQVYDVELDMNGGCLSREGKYCINIIVGHTQSDGTRGSKGVVVKLDMLCHM